MNEVSLSCTQGRALFGFWTSHCKMLVWLCQEELVVDVCPVGSLWHDRGMRQSWPTPALSTRPNVPRDSH